MATPETELLVQRLQQEWDIVVPNIISEEAILDSLERRVITLIERGAETFFQLMYRLDISEKKLNNVLHDMDAPRHIARLIYDRQLQKIHSCLTTKTTDPNEDPELKW